MGVGGMSISERFKLQSSEQLTNYFSTSKTNKKENLVVNARRAVHFLKTGVRITDDKVCEWAKQNPDLVTSLILKGKAIERRVIRYENNMVVVKPGLLKKISAAFRFVFEFIKSPTVVGSIVPSSVSLAKEIVKEIPKDLDAYPRKILEVGPGVGSFTDKIIKRMNPMDILHLVEFDENFVKLLQEKYRGIPNVTVTQASIFEYEPKDDEGNPIQYDYVVSGLPLASFPAEDVDKFFKKIDDIAKPDARFSYFEYAVISKIKRIFSTTAVSNNMKAVETKKEAYYNKDHNGQRTALVFQNFPVARVLHHILNKTGDEE